MMYVLKFYARTEAEVILFLFYFLCSIVGDWKAKHGIWSMRSTGYLFVFLLLQVALPASEDTLHWCKIFKLPNVRRKHHMVRVSVELISNTNTLHVTNLLSTYVLSLAAKK